LKYLLRLLIKNVIELIDRTIINDVLIAVYPKRHEGRLIRLDAQIALYIAVLVDRQSRFLVGEEELVDPSGPIAQLHLYGILLLAFGLGELVSRNGGLHLELVVRQLNL